MQAEASPKTDVQPEQQTGPESGRSPLLSPGRNCWRIEHAHRFKLLIDADAYFSAVRAAIAQAQDSVFILGWDIDSRTVLTPAGADDPFPAPLGEFLHAVLAARPQLHIHILNWDFAMLYALEREWLPVYRIGWRKQRRLSYVMDARHPVGASHHQKVVVIDNRLAFVGGLDLTRCRWDTPEHAAEHPLRYDPLGTPYPPFHDVQAMLDGDAAAALGELARTRWERAGGKPLKPPKQLKQPKPSRPASKKATASKETASDYARDIWPAACEPDLTDFNIAIARTEPAHLGRSGVYEIRQLYLDAIAHARRFLFFENQYFTANVLSNALSARLNDEDAPEIMVISPQLQSGWLEQATMGNLRARIHQGLKAADRHGRYRMYCPHLPDLNDACLNVHSKIFAVDDDLFCVGSANMSNRSMSFDTECNLVIETQGDEAQQARMRIAIAAMRNRLLAEHLHVAAETVAEAITQYGGLHAAVTALQAEGRTMLPLDPAPIPEFDELTPELAVFDPERPIDADELVAQFVPEEVRKPAPRRLIGIGALAVVLTVTALAWRFTPLHEWINLASLVALARSLDQQALPFAPLIVILAFVVAGTCMVPVILLIAVSGVVFGPFYGALYAMAGTMLTAAVGFALGDWLGRDTLRQLLGHRVNRLSERFARRGILSMTVLRLLPVAPFAVVNVVAGASHLLLRDYLIGTMLGMFPGILLTVVFSHNLAEAVRHPNFATAIVVALLAILLIGLAFGLQRLLTRRLPTQSGEPSESSENSEHSQ